MAEKFYSITSVEYCQHSLEAYKFLRSAPDDLRWQITKYQPYRERLEAGQRCCPALSEKAAALRPDVTDPAAAQRCVERFAPPEIAPPPEQPPVALPARYSTGDIKRWAVETHTLVRFAGYVLEHFERGSLFPWLRGEST